MANRNKRSQRRIKKSKKAKTVLQEPLSDVWHTMKKACKMMDISGSTFSRWSEAGIIRVSKRGGKVYMNEYHYQQCMKDGLK